MDIIKLNKTLQMKFLYRFFYFVIIIIISSCNSLPELSDYPSKEIKVASGPEDIIVDSISGNTDRLLISCSSRRKNESSQKNGIYAFQFEDESVKELIRENEPNDIEFHPHGFDMAMINNQAYLYVINHEDHIPKQSILVYKVFAEKLVFTELIENEMIISPNDIFVNNGGGFYISNDSGVRGSKLEMLLGQKKGSLIYFPTNDNPVIVDAHLGYPNGVYFYNDNLYVSTVREKKLYRYHKEKLNFTNKTLLASDLKGGDNLNPYQNGLLIPTHPNFIAFLRHKKDAEIPSPSVIYHYKFGEKEAEVFFADDGNKISAASTALVYKNKLYLSQVFNDFILVVDLIN